MKTGMRYFVFVAAVGFFPASAFVEVEERPTEYRALLAQPNPVLSNIGTVGLNFLSNAPVSGPNEAGAIPKALKSKAHGMLRDAGIKVIPEVFEGDAHTATTELRVCLDLLKLEDSKQCVFRIQTSLARILYLTKDSSLAVKADVWMTRPVMKLADAHVMPDKISEVVLDQVQSFIAGYQMANPKIDPLTASNATGAISQEKSGAPGSESPAARHAYIGSKNSKVFHKPGCDWALRISPANLVGYSSHAQAIRAGKRPCKQCKP
jgi:hypothetical protein